MRFGVHLGICMHGKVRKGTHGPFRVLENGYYWPLAARAKSVLMIHDVRLPGGV